MTVYVPRPAWRSLNTTPPVWPGAMAELFIHHTGAPAPAPTVEAESSHMRALQAYAVRPVSQGGKGYSDLDYNVVVGRSGAIYEGRGFDKKSAATLDRNNTSRSICVMGNYQTADVTASVFFGVVEAARMLIAGGHLSPLCVVRGHRDNPAHPGATACPGATLHLAVPAIADAIHQGTPPTNGAPMETVILSIAGAGAIFRANLDYPTGLIVSVEWSGPGGAPNTDRMLARSANLRRVGPVPVGDLDAATLFGPMPYGDAIAWYAGLFFRWIP